MKYFSLALVSVFAFALYGCRHPKNLVQMKPVSQPLVYSLTPMNTVQIGDTEMAFYEAGKGRETLLLVHGLGSNSSFWKENVAALATKYRVIALDLPGYGASSKENVPATMPYFADKIAAFMDAMHLQKVHYMGISMGGQIGMTLALNHPERVDKLVLVSPAGIETFNANEKNLLRNYMTPQSVINANEAQVKLSVAVNFAKWDATRFGWLVEQRLAWKNRADFQGYADANAKSVGGMLDGEVYARLNELKQPTFVIYGKNDALIPNKVLHPRQTIDTIAEAAKAGLPHAKVEVMDQAGHLLIMEQPALFNQWVLDWLGK